MSRWETVRRLMKAGGPKVITIADKVHRLVTSLTDAQKMMLLGQLDEEQMVLVLEIQQLGKEIWEGKSES